MTVLMSADQFRGELRAKRKPVGGVYRVSVAQPLPVDGAERTLRFCFSDSSVDRMNDTIAAAGWDLADFLGKPGGAVGARQFRPADRRRAQRRRRGRPSAGRHRVRAAGDLCVRRHDLSPGARQVPARGQRRLHADPLRFCRERPGARVRASTSWNRASSKSASARCRRTRTRCKRRVARASTRGRWWNGQSERSTATARRACRAPNWNAYAGQQRNRL